MIKDPTKHNEHPEIPIGPNLSPKKNAAKTALLVIDNHSISTIR